MESEYFPRPRYDGYCLLAEEDPQHPVPSSSQGYGQILGLNTPAGVHFPRAILTQERERKSKGKRRTIPNESLKSVSFNPEPEFQVI